MGAFFYSLVTTQEPPSPYVECAPAEREVVLQQQRAAALKQLQQFELGDEFNAIVVKMLFLQPGNYFLSAAEVQFELKQAWATKNAKPAPPKILSAPRFYELMQIKSNFSQQ